MKKTGILIMGLTMLLFACNTQQKNTQEDKQPTQTPTSNTQEMKTITTPKLTQQLEERVENFTAKAPPEKVKSYQEAIDKVAASGILENAIQTGQQAPNFTLSNATGENVSLYQKTKDNYVILTWYRGGWCPYCNLTLAAWQEVLPSLKDENISLVTLTPELPDSTLSTKEKNALDFEVLSDIDNQVAKQYGIVFELDDSIKDAYKKMGLEEYNGNDSYELPLAATYVINSNNEVVYAFLDADYRKRAEPSEVIEKVRQLRAKN